MFVLDEEGRFTYVNQGAEEVFEADRRKLEGRTFWGQIPEDMRGIYREPFEQARERGEPTEFETRCPLTGRWYRFQAYPSEDSVTVHAHDITEETRQRRELERRERALRDAYEITTDREAGTEEKIRRLLALIRGTLGTEVGLLSRSLDEREGFELVWVDADEEASVAAGACPPPTHTRTCSEVLRTEQTLVMHDVKEQTPDLFDAAAGVRSYLGAPVRVDGELFGSFCFFSTRRRSAEFDEWETTFVEMFADWVGAELERAEGRPEV